MTVGLLRAGAAFVKTPYPRDGEIGYNTGAGRETEHESV